MHLGISGLPGTDLIALTKPQFEVGRERIGKGGLISDPALHQSICEDIRGFLRSSGWKMLGIEQSPSAGGDGNREFLIATRKS